MLVAIACGQELSATDSTTQRVLNRFICERASFQQKEGKPVKIKRWERQRIETSGNYRSEQADDVIAFIGELRNEYEIIWLIAMG